MECKEKNGANFFKFYKNEFLFNLNKEIGYKTINRGLLIEANLFKNRLANEISLIVFGHILILSLIYFFRVFSYQNKIFIFLALLSCGIALLGSLILLDLIFLMIRYNKLSFNVSNCSCSNLKPNYYAYLKNLYASNIKCDLCHICFSNPYRKRNPALRVVLYLLFFTVIIASHYLISNYEDAYPYIRLNKAYIGATIYVMVSLVIWFKDIIISISYFISNKSFTQIN